jgi:hypothetical protein
MLNCTFERREVRVEVSDERALGQVAGHPIAEIIVGRDPRRSRLRTLTQPLTEHALVQLAIPVLVLERPGLVDLGLHRRDDLPVHGVGVPGVGAEVRQPEVVVDERSAVVAIQIRRLGRQLLGGPATRAIDLLDQIGVREERRLPCGSDELLQVLGCGRRRGWLARRLRRADLSEQTHARRVTTYPPLVRACAPRRHLADTGLRLPRRLEPTGYRLTASAHSALASDMGSSHGRPSATITVGTLAVAGTLTITADRVP